jgi:hypothetical protein
MIKKSSPIDVVFIKLYGEALDQHIVEKHLNADYEGRIPLQFQYNGSWLIEHRCQKCNGNCCFGFHFDSSKSPYSNMSFFQMDYLCTKYYKKTFLTYISELFFQTRIIENEKGAFAILKDNYDSDFPITSSIQPIIYQCPKCHSEFLCQLRNCFPNSPEKGCIEGLIGIIFIDEIIQIDIDGNKKFIELLEEHKIK